LLIVPSVFPFLLALHLNLLIAPESLLCYHNPIFQEHNKHLDIDCHIVREKAQQGLMRLLHVSSSNQIANMFTQALPPNLFNTNSSKLELINIFSPPTCGVLENNKEKPGPTTI